MPALSITFDEKVQPLEINFSKDAPLSWDTLVDTVIKSNTDTCIDLPIIFYYKVDNDIDSIESDSQLQALITQSKGVSTIHLFGTKNLADKPVFEKQQPPAPSVSAFTRLGQLIDTHKPIISSNRRLSRCVGILASAIALDTDNKDFDKEFTALEKVIQARKEENTSDGDEKALKSLFKDQLRGRGRPGFGRGFGGRHHHHHDEHSSRGGFSERGRGHHHHHHHGPPIDIPSMMALEEKRHKKHKKAQACFRGGRGSSSSENSSADEMEALRSHIKNTHIHQDNEKKHHRHHHHPRGGRGRGGSPFSFF